MEDVLSGGARKDQDIIYIHKNKAIQKVSVDIIHQGVEHCWGIGEAKGHDQVLEVAQECVKHRLSLIPISDPDQVVCISQV